MVKGCTPFKRGVSPVSREGKYSGFGRANIPGFIPVYSGLFRIFRDFIPDIPGLFKGKCMNPNTHILKSKVKCSKMARLVPKWNADHF
jgi:hypothetical protein